MTHLFLLWMQISVQENSCAVLHGVNVPYTVESDRRIICDFCCTIPSWNAEQTNLKQTVLEI